MNTTIAKKCAARELVLQHSFGVLSTISIEAPGYPFGSVTPYCVDDQCRPVIYISLIAQHTKNIIADSRLSLTVLENNGGSDDVQAGAAVQVLVGVLGVRADFREAVVVEGAIVGARSVVTSDVPRFTIVAGNPARVIRQLEPENSRQ